MASIIVVLSVVFSGLFPGCVTDTATLKIEKSLPQNKLAYYNDSFDELRNDLWDQAGLVYQKQQLQNYKSPDMRIENGQLLIQTQVGSFSKGHRSSGKGSCAASKPPCSHNVIKESWGRERYFFQLPCWHA